MTPSYAHQNYVHDDTPTTAADLQRSLAAALFVTQTLNAELRQSIRWAFRGYLAFRCHISLPQLYSRYTDVSEFRYCQHCWIAIEKSNTIAHRMWI